MGHKDGNLKTKTMKSKQIYFVYINTNRKRGSLYIGITNNLYRRSLEHKEKKTKGFTAKYNINKLVYYEEFDNIWNALEREKQLKKWRREKKNSLIESFNPEWKDLSDSII